jgi:hypothetical protein
MIEHVQGTLEAVSGEAPFFFVSSPALGRLIQKSMQMLKRYLRRRYGLSRDQYRLKWNLPGDYPMVAPNYAVTRSSIAKKSGLRRRKRRTAPGRDNHRNIVRFGSIAVTPLTDEQKRSEGVLEKFGRDCTQQPQHYFSLALGIRV